ncbi:MAG TPA: hypothetical protein PKD54_07720, partial [Pirellulaceae bacterium]|nr:hypothetical protein [Pirellulaceae bacterium]
WPLGCPGLRIGGERRGLELHGWLSQDWLCVCPHCRLAGPLGMDRGDTAQDKGYHPQTERPVFFRVFLEKLQFPTCPSPMITSSKQSMERNYQWGKVQSRRIAALPALEKLVTWRVFTIKLDVVL